MEDLKHIVRKINEMFGCDYNVSSFNAITGADLLNVVMKIMKQLHIIDQTIENDANSSILHMLQAIKYEPPEQITPEDFLQGIAAAKKTIIHPILKFLLDNPDNVKKRFYLSQYVTPVEIPPTILEGDEDTHCRHQAYSKIIEKFWKTYAENCAEAKDAAEARELEEDIYEMKNDMINLEKRLDLQRSKADYPAAFLQATRELISERRKQSKLREQLNNDKREYQEHVETIRGFLRRDKVTSLEDLLEKAEYNTSSEGILMKSTEEIDAELEIIQRVAKEPEPFYEELTDLEAIQKHLQQEVNILHSGRQRDDTIGAFENQQKILGKKRTLLAKQIIKLRLNNEQLLTKIEEVCQALGGDILRGKKFKDYVTELKALASVYKTKKVSEKALLNEEAILKQTLQVLHELEPSVAESKKPTIPSVIQNVPIGELRAKTLKLRKDYEEVVKRCYEDETRYQRVKDAFSDTLMQFDSAKHAFNEDTDFLPDTVDTLQKEVDVLQSLLRLEEDDLKAEDDATEQLQDDLFRYSQMFIDAAGDVSVGEMLGGKLQDAQGALEELRKAVDLRQQEAYQCEAAMDDVRNVIKMLRTRKM